MYAMYSARSCSKLEPCSTGHSQTRLSCLWTGLSSRALYTICTSPCLCPHTLSFAQLLVALIVVIVVAAWLCFRALSSEASFQSSFKHRFVFSYLMEVDLFFRKSSGQKPEKGEKVDWGTRFGTGFLSFFGLILVLWGPLLLSSLGGEMQTLGNLVNAFSIDLRLKTTDTQLNLDTQFNILLTTLDQTDTVDLPCAGSSSTWWWETWFPDSLANVNKTFAEALKRPLNAHHSDYEKRCLQDCVACLRQHVQREL